MQSKLFFFTLLGTGVALEVAADLFFKLWTQSQRTMLFAVGLGLYFSGTIFWAFSLRYEALSKAIVVFTLLNLIAVVLIGTQAFGERLSITNSIGILLAMISILLMEF